MENQLEKLKSPLGEITVMVDGHPIDYITKKGSDNDVLWPDVRNRYQIEVRYVPDGNEHCLSCVFCRLAHMKKALRVVKD